MNNSLQRLFEEQVKQTPHNIAVSFQDQKLTYRELDSITDRMALLLRKHYSSRFKKPFVRETMVGVLGTEPLKNIISILSIIKAGGAYVPLDSSYPKERVEFMLHDSGLKILLTTNQIKNKFNLQKNKDLICICLEDCMQGLTNNIRQSTKIVGFPNDLAYVIYTSGSTGKPKGVLIEQKSIIRLVKDADYINFNSEDHIAQAANICFDAATFEIWGALLNGAELVCVDKVVLLDNKKFDGFLVKNKISILMLTSELFNQHVVVNAAIFKNLKYFLTGGDVLNIKAMNKLLNCSKGKPKYILHCYGPTENTTYTTTYNILGKLEKHTKVPIGKSIKNTHVYVLDQNLKLLTNNKVGELYTGGDGLARAYLNNPELTRQKFIYHTQFGRLYKTGDLARQLPDGNIDFIGRTDNQIKIRGFRVELEEIESVLLLSDLVSQCVVSAYGKNENKILVAYFVSSKAEVMPGKKLRDSLKVKLPDYMIPSLFIQLQSMPLSSNGKIDQKSLPDPFDGIYRAKKNYAVPESQEEKALIKTWEEVLNQDHIGIGDDFFELGGNSLNGMQIISRINKIFNVSYSVGILFQNHSIASIANILKKDLTKSTHKHGDIKTIKRTKKMPLSYAQKRLWFINQYQDASQGAYNVPFAVELSGILNIKALEKSINFLIDRHEVFHSKFKSIDGEPWQEITQPYDIQLHPELVDSKEIFKRLRLEAGKPFDLMAGRLIRVNLFQLGAEQYVLFINQHHIITDGWSLELMLNELKILYNSYVNDLAINLPDKSIDYMDFVDWQCSYLTNKTVAVPLDYWGNKLSGFKELNLTTDFLRSTHQVYNGETHRLLIKKSLVKDLKKLSLTTGTTLFMILLAAFNILLCRYSGQEDIVVGSPVANRNHPDLENIIGVFVNTLALRNDLSGNPTFFDFLERIKQTCLDAYANQEVPFEQVIDELKIKRNYGVNPVFQIMFVLQPEKKQEDLSLSNITSKRICIDPGAAKFDLTFNLLETKEGLTCEVEYRIDLYKKMTICRMADHFVMLLQEIIQNPKNKIKEFSILTRQEQSNILLDWNNTEKTYGLSNPLHQLFEEQARETPDNTAIVFNKKCFSYGQLDKQTNQLAHYLQNYNVKSEQIVAVCLERSNIMIVSLLGVLKSGCAYLPIDPDYPIARIQYILEDSKAGMILTQKKYANKINEVLRGNDFKAKIIVLDDVSCDYHSEPDDSIVIQLSINMLAYVMYTSGSTGKPKGVLIEHKSLINFLYSMQDVFKLDCRDRMLALTPFTFDISGLELYLPLITGACCIISDKKTSSDANRINQMIMDHKISIMQATPATWQMLIDDDWKNSTNIKVLCGGEALSKDLANRLFNLGSPIWNLYGPTETTIWSALYKLKSCPDDVSVTPIGKPIANTQVYILNKYLQPLPIGVPGELYIGGVGLARGYLNRPELTKEKFIKSPFSKEKGSRLYKTGDLVRWMPDGNIEFLGRIDDQVKIRGFRIELDEVNKQLSQIAGVTNSVVLAKDDAGSNKYLAAYLVYQDKSKHDIASIRQQLQQFLPDYMIPEQFFVLDRLPVTPNGKVDRQALLALQQAETESIEPATDSKLEEKIAKVMAELLSTDKVDVSQNFFEMGMHSFLIVQACSRLNAELATNLKPVDLFTYPTIRSISMFLYKPDTDSSPFVAIADRINLKKSKQAKRRKNRYGDTQ